MLNKFLVAGRMTADPEIKTIGENRLCKFTIACDRPKRKGEENPETDFFPCTAWNRNADVIVDWFGNGIVFCTVFLPPFSLLISAILAESIFFSSFDN